MKKSRWLLYLVCLASLLALYYALQFLLQPSSPNPVNFLRVEKGMDTVQVDDLLGSADGDGFHLRQWKQNGYSIQIVFEDGHVVDGSLTSTGGMNLAVGDSFMDLLCQWRPW